MSLLDWKSRVSLLREQTRKMCSQFITPGTHWRGAVVPGFLARQKNGTLVIYKAARFCFPESPGSVFAAQCGASLSCQRTPINTLDQLITFSCLWRGVNATEGISFSPALLTLVRACYSSAVSLSPCCIHRADKLRYQEVKSSRGNASSFLYFVG